MTQASSIVATLATFGIGVAIIYIGIQVGMLLARKTRREWVGWVAGIAVAAAIFVPTVPVVKALKVIECKADTFPQACMDGD